MSNLHKFQTESDYYASMLASPSVSLVAATDAVHYDNDGKSPSLPPMLGDLKITYNVGSTGLPVTLFNKSTGSGSGSGSEFMPYQMWVDGVEVTPTDVYVFSTRGNHIVEYRIAEIPHGNCYVKSGLFKNIYNITEVEFADNVYDVGDSAFYCDDYPVINKVTCHRATAMQTGENSFRVDYYTPMYIPNGSLSSYNNSELNGTYHFEFYAIPT